jgi:TPR repeat protein
MFLRHAIPSRLVAISRSWLWADMHRYNSSASSLADEIYHQALEALEKAEKLETELKEKRNRQQYEAYERQLDAQKQHESQKQEQQNQRRPNVNNNSLNATRNGGIVVVKTIAKQMRERDETELEQANILRKKAHSLMEEAALEHGHATALIQLGTDAWLQKQDLAQAKEYYRLAGEKGSPEGWYNLGNLLWDTIAEDENARDSAMYAFHKAMELGDTDALYFLGVQYLSDDERKELHQVGSKYIQSAAEQGHSGALYYLALLHLHGHKSVNIPPCSDSEFISRLNQSCSEGSPDALFLRGHAYYHGEHGLTQSYRMALRDFLDATDAGNADAAVSAGAMLHKGITGIIPRDQRRAFELYQEAGEMGSKEGWRNVVACYATGEGVPQSKEMASYITQTMLKEHNEQE